MLIPRVIPCLLIKNSSLVKTIKFKKNNYIGDPVNTIRIFNNCEVDELILLDITATKKKRKPNFELIKKIAGECFMPLTYGGGIKNIEDAKKIFHIGVEKIVICTHAVENPNFVQQISSIFGSQSIVISIDVKNESDKTYKVYTNSGEKMTNLNPVEFAYQMEKMGAGEIFLNSIDKDGTMKGYDFDLIKKVSEAITVPLIACGGAGHIDDCVKAIKAGASAVAAGSIFVYQGLNRAVLINYPARNELENILLNFVN